MNPFVAILSILLVIGWIGGSISLIAWGAWYIRTRFGTQRDSYDDRTFYYALATGSIVTGVVGMLLFGAVATGGLSFGHPDGCYYLHTQLIGKTIVQQYDPIQCVGADVA